jgi:hypothetical protein
VLVWTEASPHLLDHWSLHVVLPPLHLHRHPGRDHPTNDHYAADIDPAVAGMGRNFDRVEADLG